MTLLRAYVEDDARCGPLLFLRKSSPLPVVIIVRRWGGVRRSGGIAWTPEARQSNHSSWKANG